MNKQKKPNVIMILADDLGWMDTSAYGSRYYETPHIERLAKMGMLFTDAYAANPLCSPTRASLMTGKYPHRLNITTPSCHLPAESEELPYLEGKVKDWNKMIEPRSRRYLPLEEYTIGHAFKDSGYETALIGKWHLGIDEKHWPRHYGFDHDMGAPNPGPPSYFAPFRAINFPAGEEGEYVTDRVTDEAIRFIEGAKDRPFFLCLWHFAVHSPFEGKSELIEYYRNKRDPRGFQDCPTMAAMVKSMDDGVGSVLDKLDKLDLTEDTIIVFMSDNGGNMYDQVEYTTPTNNLPLRNGKGNIHEGGVRVPFIVSMPNVVAPGSKSDEIISSIDLYPTLLELAGIAPNPRQVVDGVSIVPALRQEGKVDREAIFCHFPHTILATHNLPSSSVRRGDWKLIRFYGEGENRTPGFALYNLRDDIGESNNLAERMPELVKELDGLISRHLEETEAIVPILNPEYDPSSGIPWKPRVQSDDTA